METFSKIGAFLGLVGLFIGLGTTYKARKDRKELLKEMKKISQAVPLSTETKDTIDEMNMVVQDETTGKTSNWRYVQEKHEGLALKINDTTQRKRYFVGKLYEDNAEIIPDNEALPEMIDTPIGIFKWSPRVRTPSNWGWIRTDAMPMKPVGGLYDDGVLVEVGYECDEGHTIFYHNRDELINNVPVPVGADDSEIFPNQTDIDETGLDYDDKYSTYYPMPFRYKEWLEMQEQPEYYDIESGYED